MTPPRSGRTLSCGSACTMTTAMVSLVGVPAQLRRPSRGTALWWPRGNSPRCYEAIPDFARAYGMGSFSNQHHDLDVTWDLHWFAQSRGLLVVRTSHPTNGCCRCQRVSRRPCGTRSGGTLGLSSRGHGRLWWRRRFRSLPHLPSSTLSLRLSPSRPSGRGCWVDTCGRHTSMCQGRCGMPFVRQAGSHALDPDQLSPADAYVVASLCSCYRPMVLPTAAQLGNSEYFILHGAG